MLGAADEGVEQNRPGAAGGGGGPDHASLVFRLCVVAIWADGSMAAGERDHLSHLIDSIGADDADRDRLRRMALHDLDHHAVLAELDRLTPAERLDLYDRCLAALTSDRRIGRQELGFLKSLRRRCGVGWWRFERLAWRLAWRRRALLLAGLATVAVLAVAPWWALEPDGLPPVELAEHAELILAPLPVARPRLPPEGLYETVRRSVVTINVVIDGRRDGIGSGSVLGLDASGQLYVLTNRHVVYHELPAERLLAFEVQLESGVKLPAVLDFYSRDWDLALLVVPRITGWARPLPLLPRSELQVGQQVYAVSSPMGLDHTFTSGVISALREAYIQTDATVHQGSSGGPLFDTAGVLCGIITTTHQHKNLSFALCADAVLALLAERAGAEPTDGAAGRRGAI